VNKSRYISVDSRL